MATILIWSMDFRWPRLDWTMFAFAAGAVYGAFLAAMFFAHFWLVDAHGHIVANDFIDVWTAGHMAWSGHAAQVYDWQAHRAAEIAVAGQAFDGYFGWHYPPPFLFVAMALASVPYVVAFFAILIATLPLYLLVTDRIAQTKQAWLFALAFPATLMDLWVGQNGFLTAALIGGTLLLLEEQPLLSGICLGLLTYKPQFGILFPFVLLASGHWRTCLAAALTAGCMIGLSWLAFGSETWIAFFHSVPRTSEMILGSGRAGWNKLQTIYGFLRWAGASDGAAWSAQIATALLLLAGLIAMWRSRLPFALRAAALCVCTLLATPYAYIYDFPLLALAIAFLYRDRAFNRYETGIVGAACLLILALPWTGAPLGLASSLLVASLVSRRARVLIPARQKTPSRFELDKLAVAGAGAVVFAYAAALAMMFVRHLWIVDAKGRPLVIDFVEVWVAGLSVLSGNPSAPYDWRLHHAAQVAVVGHPFAGFLGWHYPPLFLFVAAALAAQPYVPAFIAWVCATAALYAFAIWKIAKRSEAALIALAMPAALGCAVVGQNGFFTAAIIGAALLALESRPGSPVCSSVFSPTNRNSVCCSTGVAARWKLAGACLRHDRDRRIACAIMAHVWCSAIRSVLLLSACHRERDPGPRHGRFRKTAKHLWSGALVGCERHHSVARAWRGDACGRVRRDLAMEARRSIRAEGRGTRQRHADRDALSLYVRLPVVGCAVRVPVSRPRL